MKKYLFEFKGPWAPQETTPLETKKRFELNEIIIIYYNRFAPKFKFQGERHNFYEFYYVASGKMIATINDEKYELEEDDYIVVPPMLYHSMEPNNAYATGIAVCFDATGYEPGIFEGKLNSFSKQLLANIVDTYSKNYNEAEFRPKILPSLEEKDYAYGQALKSCVELLLINILQEYKRQSAETEQPKSSKNQQAQKILKYIETHFSENPSLQSIAENLNYSIPHICRLFKQAYNESIVNFIIRLKIDEAMKLIEQNEKSLREISETLGFDNVAYFSKVFKKHTDMTPSDYRKYASRTHLLNSKYIPTNYKIN